MFHSPSAGRSDRPESICESAGREGSALSSPGSIWTIIQGWADRTPGAVALVSSGRAPLSYAGLFEQMQESGRALRRAGVGQSDTVAMVLPDGPETAAAFLGIASAALCAPLNPSYREAELEYYLSDLNARALVLPRGSEGPAREVACRRGLVLLELEELPDEPCGRFELADEGRSSSSSTHRRPPSSSSSSSSRHPTHGSLHSGPRPPAPVPRVSSRGAGPEDPALVLHTSGTTSRPKIVPLTHANLCASARNIGRALRLAPADRCLHLMPLFHIHGLIGTLLSSLAAGASVAVTGGFDGQRFFSWLEELCPTWYTAVPTMHQAILARTVAHADVIRRRPLRLIRSSSSALPPVVMEGLEAAFSAPVIEAYGMTEASHQMASNRLPPGMRKPGSVGVASGPEIAILDEAGAVLPQGAIGEVSIRGTSVTGGYRDNPQANATAFTAEGWFRTGDQGYLDEDGYLFLTGRLKELINRGGEKISPREIDERLLQHPAVRQALAFAIPDERLGEAVGAAVVLADGAKATEDELQLFVAERLAEFKVPQVVFVPEIPRGPTGKLQRIGLAEKLGINGASRKTAASGGDGPAAPVDEALEAELTAIWKEILRVDAVGRHDSFLSLGGDSLAGARLLLRVAEQTGVRLLLPRLFGEAGTVAGMAGAILAQRSRGAGAIADSSRREAEAIEVDARSSVSIQQQALWLLDRLDPTSRAYSRPCLFRVRGELDAGALERAIDRLLDRHEVLRTVYPEVAGVPEARVPPGGDAVLTIEDLAAIPPEQREEAAQARIASAAAEAFDLSHGPLFRALLLRLGGAEQLLLINSHHLVTDGGSDEILYRELTELYRAERAGEEPRLPAAATPYRWFAARQREWLMGAEAERQLHYWRGQLEGAPPVIELPLDRPRPAGQTFRGACRRRELDPQLLAKLRAFARREGATLFMVLLAGFQVLLQRCTGQEDFVVGIPTANRTTADDQDCVGYFANMLPLRCRLQGAPTFREVLRRAREAALEGYAHQELPFESLVEALQPDRSSGGSPVFQVALRGRQPAFPALPLDGTTVEHYEIDPRTAKLDLMLSVAEGDDRLRLELEYNTDLFEPWTAERMLSRFETILAAAELDPSRPVSRLPVLPEGECAELDTRQSGPSGPPSEEGVTARIHRTAELYPERIAVSGGNGTLTYREMIRLARRVACALVGRGVGPDAVVAVCLERTERLPAALLGVLEAGGAYLPLDPSLPEERLQWMLRDAGARIVLTDRASADRVKGAAVPSLLIEELPGEGSRTAAAPLSEESLAYVIYTSGSTGWPKGVAITRRELRNRLDCVARRIGIRPDDVHVGVSTISFDMSVLDVFLPFWVGARLELATRSEALDGGQLADRLHRCDATMMQATPVTWRLLQEAGWRGSGKLRALCGGEAMPADLALFLRERCAAVWNLYGPTEATVYASGHLVGKEAPIPIGQPFEDTRLYVLDRSGNRAPIGSAGELFIGGAGLARGYLGRPELTAERFVPDPLSDEPGARMYATGDIARWSAAGSLEVLGRRDHQIKLRGIRIEPGEIEQALLEHPGIGAACVIAREVESRGKSLVAYYVPRESALTGEAIRSHLRQRLPEAMIPSIFSPLAAFPSTNSGKVDRAALPEPVVVRTTDPHLAPRNPVEAAVAEIFSEVLAIPQIGPDDDFFEMGGHSLLAMQIVTRVRDRLGAEIALTEVFEHSTVAGLSERISGERAVS